MLPCHIEPPVEGRRDWLQAEAVSENEARAGATPIAGEVAGERKLRVN